MQSSSCSRSAAFLYGSCQPLRGGRLAELSEEHTAKLKALRPDETVPAWAFRFLQSFPEVVVTLSGMSNFDQLKANIDTFETDAPLDEKEMETISKIAEEMLSVKTLPCTACHYCTGHCPKGLDIPELLKLYNEYSFTGGGFLAPMAVSALYRKGQAAGRMYRMQELREGLPFSRSRFLRHWLISRKSSGRNKKTGDCKSRAARWQSGRGSRWISEALLCGS